MAAGRSGTSLAVLPAEAGMTGLGGGALGFVIPAEAGIQMFGRR
ncbi:hypothetical protein SPHINGOT1_110001 [Sphingomonas sp. T1]|nr:hypothetical protein SPHINGOT1_110001 [Sphingomonas sp. T1]